MLLLIKTALIFFWMTEPAPKLAAQQMNYEVVLNNKRIGSLEAKKNLRDGLLHYLIESDVTFRFLFKMNLDFTYETTYQNDMLIKASTRNRVNEDVRGSSKVTWNGNYYLLEVKNDRSVLKNIKITYSMASLYFKEPKQIGQVFSERYGKFLSIKPVTEHRYELTMPDGKKNYYSYENGICQSVELDQSIGKVFFKLISHK